MNQPLVFEPLFKERVWGGRRLETLYGKRLPVSERIGESWELVDREEAQSVVHEGPFQGATLHELWCKHREEIFGAGMPESAHFPLLFKILDAQERLSVQVHPPASMAEQLHGEPKTEMWYMLSTLHGADLFAGLAAGVTRADFEQALNEGRVADLLHRLPSNTGDALFIPSGRVHAIGSGNLIFEVQQNSDTTYRVFDWNRVGLDGVPRELHVRESLESINFEDPEPHMAPRHGELVVECEYFRIEKWTLDAARQSQTPGACAVFMVLEGNVECSGRSFKPGELFLVPASLEDRDLRPLNGPASVLRTVIPTH